MQTTVSDVEKHVLDVQTIFQKSKSFWVVQKLLGISIMSELGVGSERSEHPVRLIVSLGALGSEPGGFFCADAWDARLGRTPLAWAACLGGVLS